MKSHANVMEAVGRAVSASAERVAHVDDDDLAKVRSKLESTLESARTSLHNGRERFRVSARRAARDTERYVHANPWSAVGIAAAAGAAIAVLGLALASRKAKT